MRDGYFGRPNQQRGATFLGMVVILGILGLGIYAGIRLTPVYLEYMAVSRALDQAAKISGGAASPAAIRKSLIDRWQVEDIKQLGVDDIEINKVANGMEIVAAYRAEAPFIANVSLVVDFEKVVVVGGGSAP